MSIDEAVINEYVNNKKSLRQIRSELHITQWALKKTLLNHGIKIRPRVTVFAGEKYNHLTVIERLENQKQHPMFLCRCDCGKTRKVLGQNLKSGRVKDCGCISQKIRAQHIGEYHRTHGLSHTRLYNIWIGMKDRCYRAQNKSFQNYGGRGISVCEEWRNDFSAFKKWALENGYKNNLSIERVDVNGNYEPKNCCWITLVEQGYNRRNSRKIYYKGTGKIAIEWGKILNCPPNLIYNYTFKHSKDWQLDAFLKYKNITVPEGVVNE